MFQIYLSKANYPKQLKELKPQINQLFVESNSWEELVEMPMLAVVGSRKTSTYGKAICEQLVREVASRGVVIVSGLALGMDSFAHQAALDVGGKTIAVLPCGLENIAPRSHIGLAKEIVKKDGALISEYPPKSKIAFKGNFIARNRIVSGLSQAILIPEASEKSGSLHTVNFGLEQGRDILAVPGPINSPYSTGCNNLIKAGATVVTSASDILDALKIHSIGHSTKPDVTANNKEELVILELISNGITDAETLQMSSRLAPDVFNQTLSMLEITGRISPIGGNNWVLR
jgi:DNA processing protein